MAEVKLLKGVLKIKVKVTAKTGLHIGGAKENVEIGGIDNIVEKLKVFKPEWDKEKELRDVPYIPGSSFKGKLRSLIEWIEKPKNGNSVIALSWEGSPCQCGECIVCKLFGVHQAKNLKEPVRLRFEDMYPTKETIELWEKNLEGGFVEIKVENMINRIKGVAENPRHTERVIAGSEFKGYIMLRIFDKDDYEKFLELLKTGFEMLEDDYLGGSGSRGYGRVKISVEGFEFKEVKDGKYVRVDNDDIINKAEKTFRTFLCEEKNAQTV